MTKRRDWSRREMLAGLSALATASVLPRLSRAATTSGRRPRALIQLYLPGGMDASLITDPKTRRDVSDEIDLPYGEGDIHTHGNSRVGPLWGELRRHLPEMAILNGVVCSTVSHMTGTQQIYQMARVTPPGSPGLVGHIGRMHPEAPLESVRFHFAYDPGDGVFFKPTPASPRSLNLTVPTTTDRPEDDLLQRISLLAKDGARASAVEDALASQLRASRTAEERHPIESTRALFARMRTLSLPAPSPFPIESTAIMTPEKRASASAVYATLARDMVFLLTERLTHGIIVPFGTRWDSHDSNLHKQTLSMAAFAPFLAGLIDLMKTTVRPDGTRLADEVGIVVSSELGRFPIVNASRGKDHFPEVPVLFWGPGIHPGQYGQTDRRMTATPISFQTGRATSSPGDRVPTLDDVGRTLLNWFGEEDAASLGYVGRPLDFLLA